MERMVTTKRLIAAATVIAALGMTSAASAQVSVSLDTPQGVAVSPSGMVYISDFNHDVIRRITPAGKVSLFAGNGQLGAPTPGPATMSAQNYQSASLSMEVRCRGSRQQRREKISGGTLSIFAGEVAASGNATPGPATQSMLNYPQGVAVDG